MHYVVISAEIKKELSELMNVHSRKDIGTCFHELTRWVREKFGPRAAEPQSLYTPSNDASVKTYNDEQTAKLLLNSLFYAAEAIVAHEREWLPPMLAAVYAAECYARVAMEKPGATDAAIHAAHAANAAFDKYRTNVNSGCVRRANKMDVLWADIKNRLRRRKCLKSLLKKKKEKTVQKT